MCASSQYVWYTCNPFPYRSILNTDLKVILYWHSRLSKSYALCCTRTVRVGATAARFERLGMLSRLSTLATEACRVALWRSGWRRARPALILIHKAASMAHFPIDLCTKQTKVIRVFREGRAECGEAGGERTLTTDPLGTGELIFTSSRELSSSASSQRSILHANLRSRHCGIGSNRSKRQGRARKHAMTAGGVCAHHLATRNDFGRPKARSHSRRIYLVRLRTICTRK